MIPPPLRFGLSPLRCIRCRLKAGSYSLCFGGSSSITPGPNAVNCINNGMNVGFRRGLVGVAAILTQATLFLIPSAMGVTALIAASPVAFNVAKLIGAGFLIFIGVRGWINARNPAPELPKGAGSIYSNALAIAVINPKSVGGYLAAFSQIVQPDVPIWDQMGLIMPTALTLTALSYIGFHGYRCRLRTRGDGCCV